MRTPEQIADTIMARLPLAGIEIYSMDKLSQSDINTALVEAARTAAREAVRETQAIPGIRPNNLMPVDELLDALEELNKTLDSHKLHNLISNQREALRA